MKKIIIWTMVIIVVTALSAGLMYSINQNRILLDRIVQAEISIEDVDGRVDGEVYGLENSILELHWGIRELENGIDPEDEKYNIKNRDWCRATSWRLGYGY